MAFPSYISNFSKTRALALAILFIAPVVASEFFLLPRFSGRYREVSELRSEQTKKRTMRPHTLLLGDSTAGRLRVPNLNVSKEEPWLNLALGGSTVAEWRLLAQESLRENSEIKNIVVLAIGNNFNNSSGFSSGPYIPYLASWKALWEMHEQSEINLREMYSLGSQKIFKTSASRSELIYSLFSFWPSLSAWSNTLLFGRGTNNLSAATPKSMQDWQIRSYHSLAAVAEAAQAKLTLIISPVHSIEREKSSHQAGLQVFSRACQEPKVHCLNLQSRFADENFNEDHVHLREAFNQELLRYLESELQAVN